MPFTPAPAFDVKDAENSLLLVPRIEIIARRGRRYGCAIRARAMRPAAAARRETFAAIALEAARAAIDLRLRSGDE
jgi:hypothetical protein